MIIPSSVKVFAKRCLHLSVECNGCPCHLFFSLFVLMFFPCALLVLMVAGSSPYLLGVICMCWMVHSSSVLPGRSFLLCFRNWVPDTCYYLVVIWCSFLVGIDLYGEAQVLCDCQFSDDGSKRQSDGVSNKGSLPGVSSSIAYNRISGRENTVDGSSSDVTLNMDNKARKHFETKN